MTDLEKIFKSGHEQSGTPTMIMGVHQAREFSNSLADRIKDDINLIAVQLDFANAQLTDTQMLVTALDFSTQSRYGAVIDNITNIADLDDKDIQKLIVAGLAFSMEETLKTRQAEDATIEAEAQEVSTDE